MSGKKYDYKEFMQNLGVGVVVAGVKVSVDYFSGNKPSHEVVWENGRYWNSRRHVERSN